MKYTFIQNGKKDMFDIRYKVIVENKRILHCKNIQPSPMRKGLKLVEVLEINLKNVSSKFTYYENIILSNNKLEIQEVKEDKLFDQEYY